MDTPTLNLKESFLQDIHLYSPYHEWLLASCCLLTTNTAIPRDAANHLNFSFSQNTGSFWAILDALDYYKLDLAFMLETEYDLLPNVAKGISERIQSNYKDMLEYFANIFDVVETFDDNGFFGLYDDLSRAVEHFADFRFSVPKDYLSRTESLDFLEYCVVFSWIKKGLDPADFPCEVPPISYVYDYINDIDTIRLIMYCHVAQFFFKKPTDSFIDVACQHEYAVVAGTHSEYRCLKCNDILDLYDDVYWY